MSRADVTDASAAHERGQLIDAMVQASFLTMAVLSKVAAEYDVSLTQLRVLGILRDRRLKMSELAEHLGLDRSTVTGLVDRAEKRGLFRRTPNESDGRSVDVELTEHGRELARQGAEKVATEMVPLTGVLSRVEATRLISLLARMLDEPGQARRTTGG